MKNIEKGEKVNLSFYSGYKRDEHPISVTVNGVRLTVTKAVPFGLYKYPDGSIKRKFLLFTSDGHKYLISQGEGNSWFVEK